MIRAAKWLAILALLWIVLQVAKAWAWSASPGALLDMLVVCCMAFGWLLRGLYGDAMRLARLAAKRGRA